MNPDITASPGGRASGEPSRRRATAWVKDDPFGLEFAELDIGDDVLHARGVAIASLQDAQCTPTDEVEGMGHDGIEPVLLGCQLDDRALGR